MHRLYWICSLTRVKPRALGALESPQTERPLPGLPRSRGCNRRLQFCQAARPRPLGPRSAGERAAQPTGSSSPGPSRASGGARRAGDRPCRGSRHRALPGDPHLLSHGQSKNHPKMRTLGHCLPGLAPDTAKRWDACTPRLLSHPIPLSFLSPTTGKHGLFPIPLHTQKLSLTSHYSETDISLRANAKRSKSPG